MNDAGSPQLLAALAETERLRLLAENVPVAIAYFERAGNTCLYANARYAGTFGLTPSSILGRTVAQVIGDEAAREIQPQVDRVLAERVTARYVRQLRDAPDPQWIEVHLVPHAGPDGDPIGAIVMIADITRYHVAEATLRESEERLAKFMQASAEGIVFHKDGLITDVNPPLLALLGQTLDEMRGRPTLDFIAPEERARVLDVIRAGYEITYDSVALHRDGSRIPVEFIVRTMMYQGERLRMTIVRDIRDRVAAQSRIEYLARHDALTGLPNRLTFLERAESLVAAAGARTLALLFIDVDHFKRVNDSAGHLAGDALLQGLAGRITGTLRGSDLVGRFAGDEFVVLLAGEQDHAAIQAVAAKLLAAIEAPISVEGRAISVGASIGVALYPQHGATPAELLKHADTAMYHAKARGRARCLFFEPSMAAAAYSALVIESELGAALDGGQFVLHYQPQQRLADGALVGIEALLRWQHPRRGLISPAAFLAVAEEHRVMIGIGQWVLMQALAQARDWHERGLAMVPMSVNLSTMQFQDAGFVGRVEAALHALGLAGRAGAMLELELTERMLMEDIAFARRTLERLRASGIRIAVDDFGTGYTSLQHLKDLPLDRLKIDRSFIQDLPDDAGAAAVTHAIIRLGLSLHLGVVAEGVRTPEQMRWLAEHGCAEVQGHGVAEPMTAADFERWLAGRPAPGGT
jgi:diguanylate cyclase (GGDEF)-like protein/PAS domain S-box-containing protein